MPVSTSPPAAAFNVGDRPSPRTTTGSPPAVVTTRGNNVTAVEWQGPAVTIFFSDGPPLALNCNDLPIGDGASVPWQSFPGLTKYLALWYKHYLDENWPFAFQLHDFLYSGEGIEEFGLTRAQADYILFLSLPRNSPTQSLVYGAVRVGGASHFGGPVEAVTPAMWARDP